MFHPTFLDFDLTQLILPGFDAGVSRTFCFAMFVYNLHTIQSIILHQKAIGITTATTQKTNRWLHDPYTYGVVFHFFERTKTSTMNSFFYTLKALLVETCVAKGLLWEYYASEITHNFHVSCLKCTICLKIVSRPVCQYPEYCLLKNGGLNKTISRHNGQALAGTPKESCFDSGQGQETALFSETSRQALRPVQPPIQLVMEALSPGLKRPGREFDHSPPYRAKMKNDWNHTWTPPISLHVVQRDFNF